MHHSITPAEALASEHGIQPYVYTTLRAAIIAELTEDETASIVERCLFGPLRKAVEGFRDGWTVRREIGGIISNLSDRVSSKDTGGNPLKPWIDLLGKLREIMPM